MKYRKTHALQLLRYRRSREGAWIEIAPASPDMGATTVAPARERGLKFGGVGDAKDAGRRSREGAWIEIVV